MSDKNDHIEAAKQIIVSLGLPRVQQNERSALCALGNCLTKASSPLARKTKTRLPSLAGGSFFVVVMATPRTA